MAKLYGHKWTATYGEQDDGDIWLGALDGLQPEQLAAGARKCADRADPWPPSAPEFKAMCKADLGLPTPDAAYMEAALNSHNPSGHKWSHDLVRLAGSRTTWFVLRGDDTVTAKRVFQTAYIDLCDKMHQGENPTALPDNSEKPEVPVHESYPGFDPVWAANHPYPLPSDSLDVRQKKLKAIQNGTAKRKTNYFHPTKANIAAREECMDNYKRLQQG